MAGQGVTARGEWRAHWGLVLAGMLGMSFITITALALGLFIPPLQHEFGWSRTEISAGLTILSLIATPLAPFAGGVADRFGSRAAALPGLFLSGLVYAAFALNNGSIWLWFGGWAVLALTSLTIHSMVWSRAASTAFTAGRGLALAVILSGSSLAHIVGPVVVQWLIGDWGWRTAYVALGLGWGGGAFVVALLLFHEPRRARADLEDAAPAVAPLTGLTLGQALSDIRVLRIVFAILMASIMASGMMVHLFALLVGAGIGAAQAASLIAALGVTGVAGQFATGWLADRSKGSLLPVACFAIPAAGYVVLLLAGSSVPLLWLGVILVGYGGGASMNITVMLITRHAGLAHFGKIFGIISSCTAMAGGVGAMLAGAIFDATGSYGAFLTVAAVAVGLAALAHYRLGQPRFDS